MAIEWIIDNIFLTSLAKSPGNLSQQVRKITENHIAMPGTLGSMLDDSKKVKKKNTNYCWKSIIVPIFVKLHDQGERQKKIITVINGLVRIEAYSKLSFI